MLEELLPRLLLLLVLAEVEEPRLTTIVLGESLVEVVLEVLAVEEVWYLVGSLVVRVVLLPRVLPR